MISLEKSKKFQTEYNNWKQVSETITNIKTKAELDSLLEQLLKTVKKIDTEHTKLSTQHIMPDLVTDQRNNLSSIRGKIQRIIKDYESSIK